MLTVYAVPVSLYCAKLRILLRHKGLDWREVPPPGGYGSDEYKRIVPSGNLPALDHDGLVVGDSEAIAEYLEEAFPDPAMLPCKTGERAKVRELSRFHDTRLEPEVRRLFPHIRPQARDAETVAAQAEAISARLAQLAHLVEPHGRVNAGRLTLADCGFPVTFLWIDLLDEPLGLSIRWPEAVLAFRNRLAGFDAVRAETEAYRPLLRDWLDIP